MPGFLLHVGARAQCAHGGQAQPTTSNPKVLVDGQPVATQASHTITCCSMPPPPAGNGPCATAQWATAAQRVRAGGQPVLLQDSQATCAPTGTPLTIVNTQTRVRGI
jgi:hypothetical protein